MYSLPLYEGVDWNPYTSGSNGMVFVGLPLYEGVDWNSCACPDKHPVRPVSLFTREWIEIISKSASEQSGAVSLFTREWIEIFLSLIAPRFTLSPSLRGSGLKFWSGCCIFCKSMSPSLRGSGLKFGIPSPVSRFRQSPSLRGSGLKCLSSSGQLHLGSLPLYEGVDWNKQDYQIDFTKIQSPSLRGSGLKLHFTRILRTGLESPSLRGSGLKSRHLRLPRCCGQSPSLRGSGLKYNLAHVVSHFIFVSLFTREWIEISSIFPMVFALSRLPLYEGVDWNLRGWGSSPAPWGLPLYEGVDWNFFGKKKSVEWKGLPLYEGVDWNDWIGCNDDAGI